MVLCFNFRMPKEGLNDREWTRRLELFAQGLFQFGRGNAPPPKSKWAKKVESIKNCAAGKAKIDLFGAVVQCKCGFHIKKVSFIQLFKA